ncbi:SDR family NAD(P)-dependent oxidoreductase, partial [Chloroflexota bacterium]
HCASFRGPIAKPLIEIDEEVWKKIIDINLTGSFLIARTVAKHMVETNGEGKKIVLISSLAGTRGQPGSGGYASSKHGVIGLGLSLAAELAQYKINVNMISPGAFDTNLRDEAMTERAADQGKDVSELLKQQAQGPGPGLPWGRLGTPDEIADLVSFLVSDQATYISGAEIRIAGAVGIT